MKTLHTILGLSLFLVATSVSASEVSGTLSTGLGNSSVTGVVISAPSASVAAGTYTATQSTSLTSSDSLSIRYTVDGSTPTCSTGLLYASAISVASSLTIKTLSCYTNNMASPVASYAYVITVPAVTGGGGGGGGSYFYTPSITTNATTSGSVAATTTKVVTSGQVLGVSIVSFAVNLKEGVQGRDVLELQKFLISKGFLKIAKPTTYFGPATKAALIAFQKKNAIVPAVGYFGPITRVLVNKMIKG